MMMVKWFFLGLLLLNLVACGTVRKSFGGDPSKGYHVTEAVVYPEYRVGYQKTSEELSAPVKKSNARAPASVSR